MNAPNANLPKASQPRAAMNHCGRARIGRGVVPTHKGQGRARVLAASHRERQRSRLLLDRIGADACPSLRPALPARCLGVSGLEGGGVTVGVCTVFVLTVGCGKEARAPSAVAIDNAPPTIEKAFDQAPPELRQSAGDAVTALRNSDDAAALIELRDLSAKPTLTPQQRDAVTRSMLAVHERLRAAAAKGDKRAEEAIEHYQATK